tara:strand:+ start:1049 stop:2842 length:1794 start_codon:yes stop_codon:yes gene_type:complete
MTNRFLTYPITSRGFCYHGDDGKVFRLNAFLKPQTQKGRGWDKCSIYVNCYPDASNVNSKSCMDGYRRQIYLNSKGHLNVNGSCAGDLDNAILLRYVAEMLALVPGCQIDRQHWVNVLHAVNGSSFPALLKAFGAFDLRAAYAQFVGGITGAKYPSSRDMRSEMSSAALTDRKVAIRENHPDHPVVDWKVFQNLSGSVNMPMKADAAPPVEDAAPPVGTGTFDPDAMTHRDLVDLARKGHDAVDEISRIQRHRNRDAIRADEAENARDAAIAERDEAIKRAEMVQPVAPAVTSNGDGTIEILGVNLPTWSGGHGPAAKPGYDLSAWQAVMQVADFKVEANAAQVAKTILDGESVRLVGPPSVGKTSGISEIAAATGAKFFLIPCGEGATDLSLISERTIASDKSFQWTDGHVTAAVRWAIDNPDTMVLAVLDEVDHLPAEVQSLLHSVLEGGTLVVNPEETLTVPSNVRWVATANTTGFGDMTGRHASAKVSDTAFTSRWNATFTVAYLPPEAEARVLVAAGADPSLAEKAVSLANQTRVDGASVSQPIVLRQLMAWARSCHAGNDPKWAWGWTVLGSMPEHDRLATRELTSHNLGW